VSEQDRGVAWSSAKTSRAAETIVVPQESEMRVVYTAVLACELQNMEKTPTEITEVYPVFSVPQGCFLQFRKIPGSIC
jgi:hypothetical protein